MCYSLSEGPARTKIHYVGNLLVRGNLSRESSSRGKIGNIRQHGCITLLAKVRRAKIHYVGNLLVRGNLSRESSSRGRNTQVGILR